MQTNTLASTICATVAIVFCVSQCVNGVRPPSTVYVNKCCRTDEWLNENHQCIIGAESTDQWWPIIYMIKKQSYFEPHGSAPRFFKPKDRTHPYCAKPEFVYGRHSVALFSNGSLYVHAQAKFIEADDFCVDKDVAIVCDPDSRQTVDKQAQLAKTIKLHKCCGRDAVYRASENTCRHTGDTVAPERLVANATNIEFVFGFPNCKVSKYFTIAEQFEETGLDTETGRLVLRENGRKLDAKSYCLEYVHEGNASVSVKVFTCGDHLSASLNDATDIADTVNMQNLTLLHQSHLPTVCRPVTAKSNRVVFVVDINLDERCSFSARLSCCHRRFQHSNKVSS